MSTSASTPTASFANRFYGGLRNTTPPTQAMQRNELQPPRRYAADQHDVLHLLEEQKNVTKELQKQNNGLLLLTAKISKELQSLRKEASEIRENASEMKSQFAAQLQAGKENCGSRRKQKLSLALTVSKFSYCNVTLL